MHLVLKSSHAKGRMSFLAFANRVVVEKTLRERAKQFQVVIQGFENMGNHIHLIVKFKSRAMFQRFLKTVTGLIARLVTGARRGNAFGKRFFDHLAFSRIVQGTRDLRGLVGYFFKNEIEREVGGQARAEIEMEQRRARRARAGRMFSKLEVWSNRLGSFSK
jgi:REP element-mobilizing transposase RayT